MNLKVGYQQFWPDFNQYDNVFTWLLRYKYNVIIDNNNPDLIISGGGPKRKGVKTIYFSGEPFFLSDEQFDNVCDFGMSGYHIDNSKYYRFPLYLYYIYNFIKNGIIKDVNFFFDERTPTPKTKFCNFISRSLNGKRGEFFKKLNEYKRIDTNVVPYTNINVPGYGGSINGSLQKLNFIKDYKFTLSFENSSTNKHGDGYTTEKLVEPMVVNSLPIYWGNTRIDEDFNTNSILSYFDYNNDEELIDKIIELDNNEDIYNEYFKEPFVTSKQNTLLDIEYLVNIFDEMLKK